MKLRHLYPALLLGLAPTATHAEMTRMSYSQLADVGGQAYYISLGSVDIPFGFKTLAERHIEIGPLGISAFAQGVESRQLQRHQHDNLHSHRHRARGGTAARRNAGPLALELRPLGDLEVRVRSSRRKARRRTHRCISITGSSTLD